MHQPTELVSGLVVPDAGFNEGDLIANRYLVERELGRGGMGVVYLVKDQQLRGKEIALKLISHELTSNPQGKDRFIQEVLAAQELTHKNVVKVFHLDEIGGQSFFTMEYVPGRSLREVIEERKAQGGTFSLEECEAVLIPVLKALEHAHSRTPAVIHRDIKPDNIVVSGDLSDPKVKVLDFGLAKLLSPSRMTTTAMTMGTAYYMAPEQVKGSKDIDQRADLFSVGVVLYEMLTGDVPSGRFELPAEMDAGLPEAIDSLVDKVLKQHPDRRHASARELAEALREVVKEKKGRRCEQDEAVILLTEQEKVSSSVPSFEVVSSFPKSESRRDPTTGMEFVWVPGGCYQMGSVSGDSDEKPVHEVCVDGFWLGMYAVTQAEWRVVMGDDPSHFKGDSNPVEQVSWRDTQEFIKRLNGKGNGTFRLPTEAEWEYAARSGGRDKAYSGGNDVDCVAWYDSNSGGGTHPVGTKAPNGLGLYDMSGNVWEWCQDWYNENAYSQHSRNNPIYQYEGEDHVIRGGCWGMLRRGVRATYRHRRHPDARGADLGFRLLRTN